MINISLTIIIGLCAGTIDIIPMIKKKMDKNSVASAFLFYFTAPVFIFHTDLFGLAWWLKGAIITFILALPNLIIIAKEEKNAVPAIIVMNIVLGTLVGAAGHILKI